MRPFVESAPGQSPGWSSRNCHPLASRTHTSNYREAPAPHTGPRGGCRMDAPGDGFLRLLPEGHTLGPEMV